MALYDASGTASGSSTVGSAVTVNFYMAGSAQGTSSGSGQYSLNFILGGWAEGTSFALDGLVTDAAGSAVGSSTLDSGDTVVIRNARGRVFGSSSLTLSLPALALGTSSLAAHAVVERPGKPISASYKYPPKTFSWLQLLQRGDLPLFLSDGRGGNVGAMSVCYSFIRIRPDGSRQLVGPQNRIPAKGILGEYYATGLAGEAGQPGNWVIQWRYQLSPDVLPCTIEMPFVVTDAVSAPNPRSRLDRKTKFGWS